MKGKTVVAVGNFDGFHLGHRKIIEEMFRIKEKEGLKPILVTFSPNPKVYFKKENKLIFTDKQKEEFATDIGLDKVVFLDFNEISSIEGKDFIVNYLIGKLNMSHIVVGFNFRYGNNRSCDINSLKELSMEFRFEITIIAPILIDGDKVSSTIIRDYIRKGSIEKATDLLGHYYYIDGLVSKGIGRGKSIGFPTVNMKTENGLLPTGVYQTSVRFKDKLYNSITNVGYNPTFNNRNEEIKVETHIINFNNSVYGEKLRIFFVKKIRDERKFSSEKELISQIKNDIVNMDLLIS